MKIGFILSLCLNVILLGVFFFKEEPKPPVRERLIIETHKAPVVKKAPVQIETRGKVISPVPQKIAKEKKENEEKSPPEYTPFDSYEFQDAGERMETRRIDFMTRELGMTEEKIAEHNRLRNDFFKETGKFYDRNPMGELSFEERRELIDLEEMLHRRLEKLHGKENWKRYKKFREDYNTKGYKKQMETGEPFIFMTL